MQTYLPADTNCFSYEFGAELPNVEWPIIYKDRKIHAPKPNANSGVGGRLFTRLQSTLHSVEPDEDFSADYSQACTVWSRTKTFHQTTVKLAQCGAGRRLFSRLQSSLHSVEPDEDFSADYSQACTVWC